jgi:alcohol dehydrogenase YqhD (iron-dependent ADH family)
MAAALVCQVQSYPGTDDNTPIFTVWSRSVTTTVTSKQVINALKDAVSSIGEQVLNIEVSEIDTHSL